MKALVIVLTLAVFFVGGVAVCFENSAAITLAS